MRDTVKYKSRFFGFSNRQLIIEAQSLYENIQNYNGCFNSGDEWRLDRLREELEHRGFTERKTIIFVK